MHQLKSRNFDILPLNRSTELNLILLSGGLGIFLTLLAIPYVGLKYGMKFSILQQNSVVFILHLYIDVLLYSLIGFPNCLMVFDWIQYANKTKEYCRYTSSVMDFMMIALATMLVSLETYVLNFFL